MVGQNLYFAFGIFPLLIGIGFAIAFGMLVFVLTRAGAATVWRSYCTPDVTDFRDD